MIGVEWTLHLRPHKFKIRAEGKVGIAERLCVTSLIYNSICGPPEAEETIDLRTQMNWRVVSAQINSFSTSAIRLLLLLITILSAVMYLTVWQPQRRSIAGSVDLQWPGGLNLFQSRLNYSSHFRARAFSQIHAGIRVWWFLRTIITTEKRTDRSIQENLSISNF